MAVRTSMSYIIAHVRDLISDNDTASQFNDQQVQDVLDINRVFVRNAVLRPAPSLTASGIINYTDYFADMPFWETDVVIQNGAFAVVSDMSTSDYLTGHWVWSLATPGKVPPLFITGKYYDVYAAAADLLERWAAAWMRNYSFSADGATFNRAQVAQAMLAQAKQYRKQALAHTMVMERSDMNDDSSGTNVVVGNTDVMGW